LEQLIEVAIGGHDQTAALTHATPHACRNDIVCLVLIELDNLDPEAGQRRY
jgi:hypothetical protein